MSSIHWLFAPAAIAIAATAPCYAVEYLNLAQAQQACFGDVKDASFVSSELTLSAEQAKAIEKASGARVRLRQVKLWRVEANGKPSGWFVVDEVLGKHEFITWCLALNADGSVKTLEVMDYRETYGDEIRRADWRRQFVGKQNGAKLKLDDDIKNISGATLSCRHITDGVKRLLATYEIAIKR